MRIGIIALLVVFITTAQTCSDEKYTVAKGEIIAVSAPDTVTTGTTFAVFIAFSGGTNGCAEAFRIETEESAMHAVLVPYYRVPNDPELICTMAIPVHELEAVLVAKETGTYVIRNEAGEPVKELIAIAPPNE